MKVSIAEGVLMQEQEGEAFLLHTESGQYFSLNQSGVTIWRALEAGEDPVEALGARWPEIPLEVRRKDTESLVQELLASGLAIEGSD